MKSLENLIILDENTLNELNLKVDMVIEDMDKHRLDYDMLNQVLQEIVNAQRIVRYSRVEKLVPMTREKMLAVALDFFQSIDEEFYRKAIDLILHQNEKIKFNMYNYHLTKKSRKRDEHGVQEYSDSACVQTENGYSTVFVPLQKKLKKDHASKLLGKQDGTLAELYVVVHEIAHLFDLEADVNSTITTEEILAGKEHVKPKTVTGDLLKESTAIAFEFLLSDYLIKKGEYPISVIVDEDINNIHTAVDRARVVLVELELAKIKKAKGKISNDDIDEIRKKQKVSVPYTRNVAKVIIDSRTGPIFRNRYAIGGLMATTIAKKYQEDKENGVKVLKEYIQASKSGDFDGALLALGIEKTPEDLKKMIRNFNQRKREMFNQKGYDSETRLI